MGLSVIIITLNEERHIAECLENVRWADEIIVMDGFSKDRTAEIAKKYTSKIYLVEKVGTGKIKNMAIGKAGNEWVLNLDADERIPPELKAEIETVLGNPNFDGYYIPRKSLLGKKWIKHAGQWPDYQLRLFKKKNGKFQEKLVHERFILEGKTGYLKNHMIHYNYDSWNHFYGKANWYSTREAQEMLGKKFVWVYPWSVLKKFFRKYRVSRKEKNSIAGSYIAARAELNGHQLKWTVPFKPLYAFIRFYIFQQGFRDGVYGLFWCLGSSYYRIMTFAKYYDMKRGNREAYEKYVERGQKE